VRLLNGAFAVSVIGLVLACTRGEETVGRDPAVSKNGPPASSEAPKTTASSTPSSGLPPIDARCTRDDECGFLYTYLIDGKCCKGTCSPRAASRAHIETVDALCHDVLGYEDDRCPTKKCASPGDPKCDGGRCTLVTP
jgi:hypothetical protein